MPKATKEQLAATEGTLGSDSTDWSPGTPLKNRTYTRVLVYAQDEGCAMRVKVDGEYKTYQMACQVPDHTARHLGMKAVDIDELPAGVTTLLRGSRNGVSIKVPWMEGNKPKKSTKGNDHLVAIPVPGNATIKNIIRFLKTECSANRPSYFISPRGVRRPLSTT